MKTRVVTTRAPHPNAFLQVPVGTEITVHWPTLSDDEMKPSIELPTPALFTHQLLDHDGEPNGIHLGVNSRTVCEQAHMDGETHNEIHEWYTAGQMLAFAAEILEAHKRKQNE